MTSTATPAGPASPTFAVTEEQDLLRSMAKDLCKERGTSARVREVIGQPPCPSALAC
jgi:hypothetical protein